jgi:hypothetical protein
MSDTVPPDPEQNLEAPARLVSALKDSARGKVFVPPTVDDAILKAARTQLRRAAKSSAARWPQWVIWPALAGVCAIIVIITRMMAPAQFARADLNRDGKVDILDSFTLAKELKNGGSLPAYLDVNGDGVVDERDVNAIASRAVALGKDQRP